MSGAARLLSLMLRVVPAPWRDSVREDLLDEAAQRRLGAVRALWIAWHVLLIGCQFRLAARKERNDVDHRVSSGAGAAMDVRLAMRSLLRRPGMAVAIALTLGIGISAVTATFAVFNHIVFRPVPGVADPDRLVSIYYQVSPAEPVRTTATMQHLEAMRGSSGLSGLAAWSRQDVGFGIDDGVAPEVLPVTRVTSDYFSVLGVRARAGRLFDARDDAESVLVVSERFARQRLGAVDVLGRRVLLNGRTFMIVGVAGSFRGVDRIATDDAWVPFGARLTDANDNDVFNLIGRLQERVTLAHVQEQLHSASRGVGEVRRESLVFEPVVFAGLSDGIGLTETRLMRIYAVLMTGVVMLLLLACANAANLLIARNVQRRHDLVLRAALGASRARLVREQAIEAVLLAIGAAVVALVATALLSGVFRGVRILSYLPTLDTFGMDWRVFWFCLAASVTALLLTALLPAHHAARVHAGASLRAGRHVTSGRRAHAVLVVVQLALSLTLLVSAGLLGGSAWRLQARDYGFEPKGVVTFRVHPYALLHNDARAAATLWDIVQRLSQVPEFSGVAFAWSAPFGSTQSTPVFEPNSVGGEPVPVLSASVSANYFAVLDVPLLAGRTFTAAEERGSDAAVPPIIVNESAARAWFGAESPLGRTLRVNNRGDEVTLQIVGLVGDMLHRDLREGPVPMIYRPAGQLRAASIMIRTALPLTRAIGAARAAVYDVNTVLPISAASTLMDMVRSELAEERLLARTGIVIAVVALILALTGLYAVMLFFVSERVREIAIRMALGARRSQVGAHVMRHVAIVLGGGFLCGIALVVATSRLIAARIYGVDPLDPLTIAAAVVFLASAAIITALLPAARAMRVDPMVSLRL